MGLYSRVIFPRLLDWSLSVPNLAKYRQELLADVTGEVLEIGFGTGLNLPYYPCGIRKITTVDVNPGMNALARKRISDSGITVEQLLLSSENLPMSDNTFDSVVSTWTLCSIANVQQALQEVYRVLKPGGRFFFVEHGLSDKPSVQVWQHRLTPIQKVVADGCHLNRDIQKLIEQHFDHVELKQFTPENFSDLIAHLYFGCATKKAL
ncbi:MAG: class I SAM-dependent methyltransferase [Nostoc sp. DedQUE08]|uniref:class I SAM-dependent methyltransferase n=1 Tax=unclassified Nostoc TaxID=2593658 RepID=UPI002AD4234C|nr:MULTISPECIES: class I SAM-dependent methyltransferase [unclassified Nostoc]MDZ8066951.1 class I SAM-dependent methyltransferase [Nostoc sp. DedQUE08]MDZ8135765.1 class I SAM-dependent methyltransferase [Nostoc sp. DedQUE04]MDZ8212586.1 class I SAM-dependent methyltransferase [Nostoc sp. ChiSLP03a]